jgi:hypothetical protein
MLNPAVSGATTAIGAIASASGRPTNATGASSSFADILVSTTGTSNSRTAAQATAAAAGAAANDVDILSKLTGAFRNGAPGEALGVETIDSSGDVIAGASLDSDGDLSVYGSGSSGDASSTIGMSLSSQAGVSWYANASSELAQASYELNALITQSTSAAGVDRAA